ncbi:MAG: 50S ribosomal protein L32e [Thermoplasmata archaeon]
MADPVEKPVTAPAEVTPTRRPKKRAPRAEAAPATPPAPAATPAGKTKEEEVRIPKRADLSAPLRALLSVRRTLDRRRPIFGRQAANRYFRIGRDGAWRRPRGLQSKQRRHYGYRTQIVSIGYRSPARVRGLVPSGFAPVLVHSTNELEGIDARRQAAIIARTVGTRRRLVLEEEARKLGIRVLNPIVKGDTEA